MKGFILLGSKELNDYKVNYSWETVEKSWKPSLATDILKKSSLEWSYSQAFEDYIKPAGYVGKVYLDVGNGIVYLEVEK